MQPETLAPEAFGPEAFAAETGVSRETLERLKLYAAMLEEASATLNLIGRNTLPMLWHRHMIDSAQLLPLLGKTPNGIMDIGTGAGFPGMVLAICGAGPMHLVENNIQKVRFLEQVAVRTEAPVTIHACKIEAIRPFHVDVVVSRALAPLETLLGYAAPFLGRKGAALFPKGKNAEAELTAAGYGWRMRVERFPSLTDEAATVLRLTELRRR